MKKKRYILIFFLLFFTVFTGYSQDTLYITGQIISNIYKKDFCYVHDDTIVNSSGYILVKDSVLTLHLDKDYKLPKTWYLNNYFSLYDSNIKDYSYPSITLKDFNKERNFYWFLVFIDESTENVKKGRIMIVFSRRVLSNGVFRFVYSSIKS